MAKQPKKVSLAEYKRRREVWLSALESGKFKQAQSQLHLIDEKGKHSFCCLGVACKVLADETGLEPVRNLTGPAGKAANVGYRPKGTKGTGENGNLPMPVADYLGMYVPKDHRDDSNSTNGRFKRPYLVEDNIPVESLISLNDSHGFSFKKIAAVIRENPHLVWKNGTYTPIKKKNQKTAKSA